MIEKHHLESKSNGGNNADGNLVALHLHCHDQIEAQIKKGDDKGEKVNDTLRDKGKASKKIDKKKTVSKTVKTASSPYAHINHLEVWEKGINGLEMTSEERKYFDLLIN